MSSPRPTTRTDYRPFAALIGLLVLAGPRRTRPFAGFAYGLVLSRMHGQALDSVGRGALRAAHRGADRHERHEARLDVLERDGNRRPEHPERSPLSADQRAVALQWAESNAADHGSSHAALIDFLFLPPEDYGDPYLERLLDVYDVLVAQPCACNPTSRDEDGDTCERCRVLNRHADVYVGGGR